MTILTPAVLHALLQAKGRQLKGYLRSHDIILRLDVLNLQPAGAARHDLQSRLGYIDE